MPRISRLEARGEHVPVAQGIPVWPGLTKPFRVGHLKRKWQAHIRLESYKSQDRVAMDVPRRQPVKL